MANEPPVGVELADYFVKKLKRLNKKYPKVRADVQAFVRLLESGETPGDQVPGVGYTVYKVRIRSSDIPRGKSGGYRILYYLKTDEHLMLLTIYFKSEQTDISPGAIRQIIEDEKNS